MIRTLLTALAASVLLVPVQVVTNSAEAQSDKPNVVFILTDDMRLDDLRYMPYTRRLLRNTGTDFRQGISPHPLCCPARAQLVTGQYAQNNGVRHNQFTDGNGGFGSLKRGVPTPSTAYRAFARKRKEETIFQWFRRAGYRTGYTGKFLNGYKGGAIPGLQVNDIVTQRVYSVNNPIIYRNGRNLKMKGHQTTVTRQLTVRMIEKFSKGRDPFFMWAGYVAPHSLRQRGEWTQSVPPSKPKYRTLRKLDRGAPRSGRVRSLYAVDDGVRQTVRVLKKNREWNNTILVFASDNGYMYGEHGLHGKNLPHQQSVRIPLMMTGPGVPQGVNDTVVTLVDLPVTLAQLTGVRPNRRVDGANMFTQPPNRAVLIQAGKDGIDWYWRGVYTRRYTYVEWDGGKRTFFDREADPLEDRNIPNDPRTADFVNMLNDLRGCAGVSCQQTYEPQE